MPFVLCDFDAKDSRKGRQRAVGQGSLEEFSAVEGRGW